MLLLLVLPFLAPSASAADAVTSLPGWETDNGAPQKMPSPHYSGYLPVGNSADDRNIHYYLQTAETNPDTAPLVLWLNGGPGSSSLFGMFTEVGQLVFNAQSTTSNSTVAPRLFYNPEGWPSFANVVFFESPVGVGWSYCAESLKKNLPCAANDTTTANDNYDALIQFTQRHPSFKGRPFFIAGESYAGIYIPMLADVIDKRGGINLQGMAVGNGCWGNGVELYCGFGKEQRRIESDFLYGHAFYSKALKAKVDAECKWTPGKVSPTSDACSAVLAEVQARAPHRAGGGPSEYVYDKCGFNPQATDSEQQRLLRGGDSTAAAAAAAPLPKVQPRSTQSTMEPRASFSAAASSLESSAKSSNDDDDDAPPSLGMLYRWCGGREEAQPAWNALPASAAAMNMMKGFDPTNKLNYTRGPAGDLRPLYKVLATKYRILIFSGDADACVPFTGSAEWTSELGFPVVRDWQPWVAPISTAENAALRRVGYVTSYGPPSKGFQFATVNNAGHEVPTFQPAAAKHMLMQFIANTPL